MSFFRLDICWIPCILLGAVVCTKLGYLLGLLNNRMFKYLIARSIECSMVFVVISIARFMVNFNNLLHKKCDVRYNENIIPELKEQKYVSIF